MPATYTLIEKKTLSNNTTKTVSFLSVPGTYRDLALWLPVRNFDGGYGGFRVYFNGTDSNIQFQFMNGEGNSWTAGSRADSIDMGMFPISSDTPSNIYSPCTVYVLNYASTSQKKMYQVDSARLRTGPSAFYKMRMSDAYWNQTTAITQVDVSIDTENFEQGSTFSLYGISNS